MSGILRSLCVLAAGVGLALLLGFEAFLALFSYGEDMWDGEWKDVPDTWSFLSCVTVVLVHVLWIITWCVWTAVGWVRFVAAAILLPTTLYLTYASALQAWDIWTRESMGWATAAELIADPSGPLGERRFLAILLPAVIVALSVLITVLVSAPSAHDSAVVEGLRVVSLSVAYGLVVAGSLALTFALAVLAHAFGYF